MDFAAMENTLSRVQAETGGEVVSMSDTVQAGLNLALKDAEFYMKLLDSVSAVGGTGLPELFAVVATPGVPLKQREALRPTTTEESADGLDRSTLVQQSAAQWRSTEIAGAQTSSSDLGSPLTTTESVTEVPKALRATRLFEPVKPAQVNLITGSFRDDAAGAGATLSLSDISLAMPSEAPTGLDETIADRGRSTNTRAELGGVGLAGALEASRGNSPNARGMGPEVHRLLLRVASEALQVSPDIVPSKTKTLAHARLPSTTDLRPDIGLTPGEDGDLGSEQNHVVLTAMRADSPPAKTDEGGFSSEADGGPLTKQPTAYVDRRSKESAGWTPSSPWREAMPKQQVVPSTMAATSKAPIHSLSRLVGDVYAEASTLGQHVERLEDDRQPGKQVSASRWTKADERFGVSPGSTQTDGGQSSARESQQPGGDAPIAGDIFLDGAFVGRWMSAALNKEAARADAGPTGYDIRRGRLLPGASLGL